MALMVLTTSNYIPVTLQTIDFRAHSQPQRRICPMGYNHLDLHADADVVASRVYVELKADNRAGLSFPSALRSTYLEDNHQQADTPCDVSPTPFGYVAGCSTRLRGILYITEATIL